MGSVIVAGSANVDTAVHVREHPHPGETVLGSPIGVGAGGKGLNQAIAAARAGAATRFIWAAGGDAAATCIREVLDDSGVNTAVGVSDQPTGSAFVMVAPTGENAIVVVPGANADSVTLMRQVDDAVAQLGSSDVLLTQLEVPVDVVTAAMAMAHERGAITILNAAPSQVLPDDLLEATDILVVNQHECADIAGPIYANTSEAALALTERVETVVVTLGSSGALTARSGEVRRFAAHFVPVVDTTAAGDTFCGAMAAELAAGASLSHAIKFGMAAAAITVQRPGSAASIPHRDDIDRFLDALSHPTAPTKDDGE